MRTIGFIGIGKIGLPICSHLVKAGYRVLGYRRSAMTDFEKIGGAPASSPAEVGAGADIVFACLPSDEALDEAVQGPKGLINSERYVGPLAEKGSVFLDGEVSGTPGMVAQRKGVIYLGGEREAAKTIEPVVAAFADLCLYFGPFGTATKVKLVNNLLVALHIAGTAQAMALGLKAGVDLDLLIKAIAMGSGGSTQFEIRAPWMAERRFIPQQGSAPGLAHYLKMAKEFADEVGIATQLLDCLIDIYRRALPSIGERDVAAILELFESQRHSRPAG
jgi:3-hydroxyisobutyrate dehydrogenase-like beta-hydroxyacid dehydrogenase